MPVELLNPPGLPQPEFYRRSASHPGLGWCPSPGRWRGPRPASPSGPAISPLRSRRRTSTSRPRCRPSAAASTTSPRSPCTSWTGRPRSSPPWVPALVGRRRTRCRPDQARHADQRGGARRAGPPDRGRGDRRAAVIGRSSRFDPPTQHRDQRARVSRRRKSPDAGVSVPGWLERPKAQPTPADAVTTDYDTEQNGLNRAD